MATTAIDVRGARVTDADRVLTEDALAFVERLQREFGTRRNELLAARQQRWKALKAGGTLDFLPETAKVRSSEWSVAPVPKDLEVRKVEITGPTDRKMVINALNSGASVYMADFEDANTPTWENMVSGQGNLIDAIERTITFEDKGKRYALDTETATLVVRPRGWHLPEKHLLVDGNPIAGAFMDFGLYFFHNARRLLDRGTAPYFYLAKTESHLEARLWNDVFSFAQDALGVPRGTIKATVLIEVVTAALEMDEILYELRDHSGGLNAGRWDYIFSVIKKFDQRSDCLLPDRIQVTMTVPFMRAYTELLVKTCHRRGALALGGMAAYIPSRRDPVVNEQALAKVREDKVREATDGFDGTWVAHPDLVATAMAEFDRVLGTKRNQLDKQRPDVHVSAAQLGDIRVPGGTITDQGVRNNVSVGIQYIASWLRGTGAAAINNLMEDAATSEIARSQVWQWVHNGASITGGPAITPELVKKVEAEELEKIRAAVGDQLYRTGRYDEAARLFEHVALSKDFVEFLTLPGYELID
ncbi:MAG: malate synthase A [Chloroflexota bacterium]|nr:malate synthase A [Chloroflexota bacterium]MDE3103106.1 malate synthase A [Chloroflexota bacterium]